MITKFRHFTDSWIAKIFFVIMAVSFVGWGISGDIFRLMGPPSWVAKVGGEPIEIPAFQAQYPQLAQYELIGTQSETNPTLLANSQLESAFQSQSSCFACHGTAAYSKTKGYFNFAQKQQDGIVYPTAPVPASEFAGYNKLDFVWSLKRAQWQR